MRNITKAPAQIIATVMYVGYVPVAPGTVASAVAAVWWWFFAPASVSSALLLITGVFFAGVWAAYSVEQSTGIIDPSHVVIDEVVGMWLPLVMVPRCWSLYLVAFLLFRFFDISKLFPVGLAEHSFRHGWGIMLDDLVAGIMTLLILSLALLPSLI